MADSSSSELGTGSGVPGGGTPILCVHSDILRTHILSRLDGKALASTACASSELRALCSDDKLWKAICVANWPSTDDPELGRVVSGFPNGYRSFFSDSFPALHHRTPARNLTAPNPTAELISAVDIHYDEKLIFSRIHGTETQSPWFLGAPFRVDALDPKESVKTLIQPAGKDEFRDWAKEVKQRFRLSWLLIDPTRHRAVNVTGGSTISVGRHWLTGDLQLRFSTVVSGGGRQGSAAEMVNVAVAVMVAGEEVREVSLVVEDMEGRHLSGRESLVVLQEAMEKGKRLRSGRFEDFMELKRERMERIRRREKAFDIFCILTGVAIFLALCSFILCR